MSWTRVDVAELPLQAQRAREGLLRARATGGIGLEPLVPEAHCHAIILHEARNSDSGSRARWNDWASEALRPPLDFKELHGVSGPRLPDGIDAPTPGVLTDAELHALTSALVTPQEGERSITFWYEFAARSDFEEAAYRGRLSDWFDAASDRSIFLAHPTLVVPDDAAWVVSSVEDVPWSSVYCGAGVLTRLAGSPELELLQIEP